MQENILIQEDHDGHRLRLRSRIERSGFERLPPHQILEFLLYYAIPRQDVNDTAMALLKHFGDLKKVLHATPEELDRVEGLGGTALEWMKLVNRTIDQCEKINDLPAIKIKNYMDAFKCVPYIRKAYPDAAMVQLCVNAADEVCYYLPLKAAANWNHAKALHASLENAVLLHPERVLIIAFPGRLEIPKGLSMENIQQYAETLSQSRCALSDVILAAEESIISMRQQGLITSEVPSDRLKRLHEAYMQDMPSKENVYRFPIPKMEDLK